MGKSLRIRDRLFLATAIAGDIFFEVIQPYSVQLRKIRSTLPPDYKLTNFTSAVSRLLKTGYMEKIIKNGEPYIRLTNLGKKIFVRDFPIFKLQNQKWDQKWRLVFYDIPEEMKGKRNNLQMKLKELGLGMIQESVYITPFNLAEDLREFIISQRLEDYVFVHVGNQILAGNIKSLVEKIWKLEELDDGYRDLLIKIKEQESSGEIISEYEKLLRKDPSLPKELLPADWLGNTVHQEIKKILIKLVG